LLSVSLVSLPQPQQLKRFLGRFEKSNLSSPHEPLLVEVSLEFGVKFDVATLTFLNTASTLGAQAADGWVEDVLRFCARQSRSTAHRLDAGRAHEPDKGHCDFVGTQWGR